MVKYVYGTRQRIFINTALGCNADCKYCYMPKLGYKKKKEMISGELAVQLVKNMACFVSGEKGTILSIGCYSECLDEENLNETKKILKEVLPVGNPVQLATKQIIREEVCDLIKKYRNYNEQMNVYISMPTISKISQIEPGTLSAKGRIENIKKCIKYSIPVVLYIKPFLEKITGNDLENYVEIVKKYKIPVVVGPYLYIEKKEIIADVGEGELYEVNDFDKRRQFLSELKKYTSVYEHSTECIFNPGKTK